MFGIQITKERLETMNFTAKEEQSGLVCTPTLWYVQIYLTNGTVRRSDYFQIL